VSVINIGYGRYAYIYRKLKIAHNSNTALKEEQHQLKEIAGLITNAVNNNEGRRQGRSGNKNKHSSSS